MAGLGICKIPESSDFFGWHSGNFLSLDDASASAHSNKATIASTQRTLIVSRFCI